MSPVRPEKHSLTLRGHRTSVSLEPEFWVAFRQIAKSEERALNDLAAEIDAARGTDCGLASAIRVHVLEWFRAQAEEQGLRVSRSARAPERSPEARTTER
jgi:predicted DNA-binding ribbon-helix-helix protein